MKLNSPRRLVREDYPNKYEDLMGKLSFTFNQFMETVSQGFNKRLNFNDNFEAFDVEVNFTAGESISIKNTLPSAIRGSTVLRVDPLTNLAEVLATGPFVQFTNSSGQIVINNITGLTTGNKYRIRIVFFI